jgi:hypothetical protein
VSRSKKPVELDKIEALARIHCTLEEIASVAGVSVSTLEKNYLQVIQRGRAHGKASLRRMLWKKANEGNMAALIWLSKQKELLGMREPGWESDDPKPPPGDITWETQWGSAMEQSGRADDSEN